MDKLIETQITVVEKLQQRVLENPEDELASGVLSMAVTDLVRLRESA